MAASGSVNPDQFRPSEGPEQLRMFMTGSEIQDYAAPGDFPPWGLRGNAQRGWANKLKESNVPGWAGSGTPSLTASIKQEGIKDPVSISHRSYARVLANGHHRVAVAAAFGDLYVPVEHSATPPPPEPKKLSELVVDDEM